MKTRARIVSGLAALAALLLAPLAEASLPRTSTPATGISASALVSPDPESAPFLLFEGNELAGAAAASQRVERFHPLAAVSLLPEEARLDLVPGPETRYPKTRVWAIDVLGSTLVSRSTGLSLESDWACVDFSCGLASGGRKDPLGLAVRLPAGMYDYREQGEAAKEDIRYLAWLASSPASIVGNYGQRRDFLSTVGGLVGHATGWAFNRPEWDFIGLAGVMEIPGALGRASKVVRTGEELLETGQKALKSTRRGNQMAFSSKAEEIVSEATGVERNLPGAMQQTIAGSGPAGTRAPDLLVRGRQGSVHLRGSIVEVKASATEGSFGKLPSRGREQIRDAVDYARRLRDRANLVKDPVVKETLESAHVEVFSDLKAPKSGEFADLIEEGILKWKKIER